MPSAGAQVFVSAKTHKPGEFCAMAQLGTTTKDGMLTLICKRVTSMGKTMNAGGR